MRAAMVPGLIWISFFVPDGYERVQWVGPLGRWSKIGTKGERYRRRMR